MKKFLKFISLFFLIFYLLIISKELFVLFYDNSNEDLPSSFYKVFYLIGFASFFFFVGVKMTRALLSKDAFLVFKNKKTKKSEYLSRPIALIFGTSLFLIVPMSGIVFFKAPIVSILGYFAGACFFIFLKNSKYSKSELVSYLPKF